MLNYFLNRLTVAILVAITVSIFAFSLLRLSGDLAAELAGDDASEAEIQAVAKAYGLDRPFHIQYLDWAGSALSGDLGVSVFSNEPVFEIITAAMPVTIKLATYSLILSLVVAIPSASWRRCAGTPGSTGRRWCSRSPAKRSRISGWA